MTIRYPKRFGEAVPANFNGIFEWDFLLPAFAGTKIEPMDIDGAVERRGRVLLFETKEPDKEISQGQQITLETLIKIGRGSICLMVIYGKTKETIESMELWTFSKDLGVKKKVTILCDWIEVLDKVSKWFKWANGTSIRDN